LRSQRGSSATFAGGLGAESMSKVTVLELDW
jgi:hypothetical protein